MKSKIAALFVALSAAGLLGACASGGSSAPWTTLIDGARGLDNFNQVEVANWSASDGAIQASQGGKAASFLVTKSSYKDFMLRAEFWASDDANSGIFMRCQNAALPTDESCYEANIFDTRPDPSYGTGAIVKVAKLSAPMIKAGGQWNRFEITLKGTRLVVMLNGVKTADIEDSKFKEGPIGLQWARGTIKFRKLEIKPI